MLFLLIVFNRRREAEPEFQSKLFPVQFMYLIFSTKYMKFARQEMKVLIFDSSP